MLALLAVLLVTHSVVIEHLFVVVELLLVGEELIPSFEVEHIVTLHGILESPLQRKHLFGGDEAQSQSVHSAFFGFGEHLEESVNVPHEVYLGSELFLGLGLRVRILAVMQRHSFGTFVLQKVHLPRSLAPVATGVLAQQTGNTVLLGDAQDEGVVEELRQRQPPGLISDETLPHEVLQVLRKGAVDGEDLSADLLEELLLGGGLPGRLAMEDLVEDHSQRPDVILDCVNAAFESFGTHVKRTAHIHRLLHRVRRGTLGETEVCDFGDFVLEEDVGRFEVPVEEARLCDDSEPIDDVPENGNGLLLWKLLAFLEEVLEVALVAELRDDVAIVDCAIDIMALDHICVIDFFQCVDLSF